MRELREVREVSLSRGNVGNCLAPLIKLGNDGMFDTFDKFQFGFTKSQMGEFHKVRRSQYGELQFCILRWQRGDGRGGDCSPGSD